MTVGSALSHAPCIGQHSRSAFTGVARRYLLEQHARLRIDAVAQGQPEISTLLFLGHFIRSLEDATTLGSQPNTTP
jgi:hypothetical protein